MAAPVAPRVRIARNLAFLTLAEVVARALALITAVVAARELGPSLLGSVALAQTLAILVAGIADGGLTLLTYRRIVTSLGRMSQLVMDTTVIQVALAVAVTGALVAVALLAPFGSGTRELLVVFAPYAITQGLNVLYVVQAREHMGWAAVIKSVTQLATAVPTVALVVTTRDPVWVAVGLIFGQFVGNALAFTVLRRHDGFRVVAPDLSAVRPLLIAGLPLLGTLLLFNYLGSLDIPVLSIFRSSREVGEYSAAVRIVSAPAIASQVLLIAVLPELVRRHAESRERFSEFVGVLVVLTTRLTMAGTAILIVAAGPIVDLLYTRQYAPSAPVLAILAPVVPLIWYAHLLGFAQVAAGRQRDFFACLVIASLTATVVYPIAAAAGGARGIAVGATATTVVQAAAFARAARRLGLSPILPALRQLPYAVVPVVLILVVRAVSGQHSLLTALPLWLAGLVVVESVGRWPTLAFLGQLRRARGVRA